MGLRWVPACAEIGGEGGTGASAQKKKAPPGWQGFSLSLFAVFRLALSGGLLLGERFSQAIHGAGVIDAFDSSELTGHAV